MSIQDLEYFAAVCRERSINRAAKLLYITPQGLSKSIKALEQELNAKLLNRRLFRHYPDGMRAVSSGTPECVSGELLFDLPRHPEHYPAPEP